MDKNIQSAEDTSRISITAHHTSYTWYANNLSHKAFATLRGRILYKSTTPWMRLGKMVLGVSDLETSLLQRHIITYYKTAFFVDANLLLVMLLTYTGKNLG